MVLQAFSNINKEVPSLSVNTSRRLPGACLRGHNTGTRRTAPRGNRTGGAGFSTGAIQKEIASRLGVSEGTVSRDITTMVRADLFPGLPAAKAIVLASGDRDAIVRSVRAIVE